MLLPFVDAVTPNVGPAVGGTAVTITGRNFTSTVSVTFGGIAAASFTVVDDNTITATTPAGTGGAVVEITNADGTSSDLTLVDYSGNGFNGLYDVVIPPKTYAPGLVSGDPALLAGDPGVSERIGADLGPYTTFLEAPIGADSPFSVAWWQSCSAAWSGTNVFPWACTQVFGSQGFALRMLLGASGFVEFGNFAFVAQTWDSVGFDVPVDGAPHFFALTFDYAGAVATFYMDASPISWASPGSALDGDFTDAIVLSELPEIIDEMVMTRSTLSAIDVAALYAAGLSGFASWNTAALGLGPTALYHFDDANSGLFTYQQAGGWSITQIGMAA